MNCLPNRLFDTQVAAAFVGLGSALSYAALVELLLGEVLEKSQTQSDWLHRPLSEAQKIYAREDVVYLERLHEILTTRLEEQNKLAWISAYTEQTLRSAAMDLDPDKAYLKVKGAVNLNRAQLASLAGLAAWRERRARELNKPRNWLVRDAEMLKIVRTQPQSYGDLDHSIGMAPESIRRYGQELLAQAAEVPQVVEVASPPANLEVGDRALVKHLQERVASLAGQYQMAERLIANRADLEDLVRHRRGLAVEPPMLSDWRSEELTPQILELVDGR
jgi:ribonuclease D